LQIHSNPMQRFDCLVCQKSYKSKDSLRKHVKKCKNKTSHN
jgi:hypothetical protein